MTKGQMLELAQDLGMRPDDPNLETNLAKIVGKFDQLGRHVLALRLLIRSSAKNVFDLGTRAAQTESDADTAAFAEALARHDMIQSTLSGATANWGRAGSAFHNLKSFPGGEELDALLKRETGRTLNQVKMTAKMVAGLKGKSEADMTAALAQFVKDSGRYSFGRMVVEYWVNGLISGLATHVTYSIGNGITLAVRTVGDVPTAALVGAIFKARGRSGGVIPFGEVGARIRGLAHGGAPAVTSSLESLRTGLPSTLPGLSPYAQAIPGIGQSGGAHLNTEASWRDASHAIYQLIQGLKDGTVTGGAIATVGSQGLQREYSMRGAIPNVRSYGLQLPIGDILRLPGRAVAANHSFFTALNYAGEAAGMEFRQAWNEESAKSGWAGMNSAQRSDAIARNIADQRVARTPEFTAEASKQALDIALMGPGGWLSRKLSEITNHAWNVPGLGETPFLKFIDPFVHISANILEGAVLRRSALGLLAPTIRDDIMGKNGNVAQDMAIARMAVGTAITLTLGILAAEGSVTGSAPLDWKMRGVWQMNGIQPHSVLIDGNWVALNRLGPIGMLAGMSADLYNVANAASSEDMATAAGLLIHGVVQNGMDESWMKGPADLLKAVGDPNFGRSYVENLGASFLPFSVGMSQTARAMDPYSRQARDFLDRVLAKVPVASQGLYPQRNLWGEPVASPEALAHSGLTSIWISKVSSDPVNRELLRLGPLGAAPGPVPRKLRDQTLTDAQYDIFAQRAGRAARITLERLIGSPGWNSAPDGVKAEMIKTVFDAERKAAETHIPGFGDIVYNATKAKSDKLKRTAPQ